MGFLGGLGEGIGAGGIGLIGGLFQNDANKEAGTTQRRWSEEMAKKMHQFEVQDLKKAGLNPILSANKGAQVNNTSAPHMEDALGKGVTSAMDSLRLKKDMELAGTQNTLNAAQALATAETAKREGATAKQIGAQTKLLEATMPNQIKKSMTEGEQANEYLQNKNYYNVMERINRAIPAVNTGVDAMRFLPKINMGKTIKLPSGSKSGFEKHGSDLIRKSDGLIINQP